MGENQKTFTKKGLVEGVSFEWPEKVQTPQVL